MWSCGKHTSTQDNDSNHTKQVCKCVFIENCHVKNNHDEADRGWIGKHRSTNDIQTMQGQQAIRWQCVGKDKKAKESTLKEKTKRILKSVKFFK